MSVLAAGPPHYTIQALDGADDDGGTLYVLYDEAENLVTGAAWPQPLERLAEQAGFPVKRAVYVDVLASDCDVPDPRRMYSDLLERVREAAEQSRERPRDDASR